MKDDLDSLSRSALKGDRDAIGSILTLAEEKLAAGDHLNASRLFRESAIFYRIDAARQAGMKHEAESRLTMARRETDVLTKFLARGKGPSPFRSLNDGSPKDMIREISAEDMYLYTAEFGNILELLQNRLTGLGADLGSQGSRITQYALTLVKCVFRIEKPSDKQMIWLSDPLVSSIMTLIADQVEQRIQSENVPFRRNP